MTRFHAFSAAGARPVLGALLLAGLCQTGAAHDDLHGQIAAASRALVKEPDNAALYLRRAELHRLHRETAKSLADLAAAARLAPESVMPHLGRARLYVDLGRFKESIAEADATLQGDPEVSEARLIRARCHERLGAVPEAIADLSTTLARMPAPQPDTYLDRARLQAAAGRLADAVAGLDEGMLKIGTAPALELAAIEYERQQAKYDDALKRIAAITDRMQAKELWLVLRAEVLLQAGRPAEARAAAGSVLDGIARFSPARRGLDHTRQLEARAARVLSACDAKPAPVAKPR